MQSVQRGGCWIFWLWSAQIKHILQEFLVYMILEWPIVITALRPSDEPTTVLRPSDTPMKLINRYLMVWYWNYFGDKKTWIMQRKNSPTPIKLPPKTIPGLSRPWLKKVLFPRFSRLYEPCNAQLNVRVKNHNYVMTFIFYHLQCFLKFMIT